MTTTRKGKSWKSQTQFIPWEYDVAERRELFCKKVYNLCQLLFLIGATLKGIYKHCVKYVLQIMGGGVQSFCVLVNGKVCKLERGFGGH